jgi:hypothetical protein
MGSKAGIKNCMFKKWEVKLGRKASCIKWKVKLG